MGPENAVKKAATEQKSTYMIKGLLFGGLFLIVVSSSLTTGRISPDRKEITALLGAINDDNMS